MWVLPKNYQTSLAFVPDMVASKEDLTLLAPTIGSSLMWRSKPSPLPTWSRRWSRVSWMPHLFGRILKPSQHTSFETALTSSLAAIRASRSARQANDRERTIPVTSGHTSEDMSEQLDLFNASSKTSKVTSRLDSTASSAIWKKMVTTQRSEYSQRLKSARLTRESASSFLPTPSATPYGTSNNGQRGDGTTFKQAGKPSLESMARHNLWPTPSVKGNYNRKGASQRSGDGLETAVKTWPTPTARDYRSEKCSKEVAETRQAHPRGKSLAWTVEHGPQWPTPSAHEARLGYQDRSDPTKRGTQESLTTVIVNRAGGRTECTGQLNPTWVEWLMGVPTGWTELGSWGTE